MSEIEFWCAHARIESKWKQYNVLNVVPISSCKFVMESDAKRIRSMYIKIHVDLCPSNIRKYVTMEMIGASWRI